MDAVELTDWLSRPESAGSGWAEDDGSGETIGHERYISPPSLSSPSLLCVCPFPILIRPREQPLTSNNRSGRKIIDILQRNPSRDPEGYDGADIDHMRRAAAYNKRHLAQEATAKRDAESRSYRSLKNWGHDAQKE